MALKFVLDTLDGVPSADAKHYAKGEDGKYRLAVDGHPDTAKVSEFRSSNVELLKERDALKTRYADIDPDAVKADRLKLSELANAGGRVAQLEGELTRERAARTNAEQQADRSRVRDVLRVKATAAGVLPAAVDILLDKADPVFTMDGDVVKAKPNIFSPTRPGEPLTPDEWLTGATKQFSFLFGRSTGSGADPKPGGGSSDGRTVLRNPTPQQLGDPENSKLIAQGKIRVEYS